MILGIDPGPERCGVVLYDEVARRVASSSPAAPVDEVVDHGEGFLMGKRA